MEQEKAESEIGVIKTLEKSGDGEDRSRESFMGEKDQRRGAYKADQYKMSKSQNWTGPKQVILFIFLPLAKRAF